MEVRFENGWAGRGWLFDPRVQGRYSDFEAPNKQIAPPVDVIEDKDAYHFYFEMPGLQDASIDARVEDVG